MARKVEINYSKVKEISDLGLSVKDTLERLHQCNINISRMQYYRWQKNNVTSKNNVTLNNSKNNVTLNGRYEVVGLGLNNRTELKGKRCLSREYIEKAKPFLPFDWK